jgi:HK97 family phage portal protein
VADVAVRSAVAGIVEAVSGTARALRNDAPVPFTTRRGGTGFALMGGGRGEDRGTQLAALGANSTLFAIVNKTSTALASVQWRLYRKAASGNAQDRVEITSHAALDMWNRPNDFYTGQVFRESWQQHLDLTGEGWWVVERSSIMSSIPLGIWPVRPDRIAPVPSVDKFIAGYIYTSPDGEKIPLELQDVIFTKMPNPNDPYRGMGPVQSLLSTIDSVKYGVEWNRNFFLNSAEPGGVVQVDRRLDDDEFDEMTARWRESHQGVAQAHRVAILEQGAQWIERKFTQRDMQFVELINLGREIIHEAFGMPRSMTGSVENVNRANAETGKEVFAEDMTVPRADRLKDTLNAWYLPMFGATAKGLEFDYDDPTPDNEEQKNAKLTASSTAAQILVQSGWQAPDVLETVGLPPMQFGLPGMTPEKDLLVKVLVGAPTLAPLILPMLGYELPEAPPPAPAPPAPPPAPPAGRAPLRAEIVELAAIEAQPWFPRAAASTGPSAPEEVDLGPVREAFDRALDELLRDWSTITAAQYAEVCDQVAAAINEDDIAALGSMTVSTADASAMLLDAMSALGARQAAQVVREGAAQGVTVEAVDPTKAELEPHAEVVAALLGTAVAMSAARAALLHYGEGRTGQQVADEVLVDLQALTDAQPRQLLGGALHGATNTGRVGTLRRAPEAALYASEIMDTNTCRPCKDVDGKWLGNVSQIEQVFKTYPFGGYIDCKGGDRCRGTVVAIWRPATVDNPDAGGK